MNPRDISATDFYLGLGLFALTLTVSAWFVLPLILLGIVLGFI